MANTGPDTNTAHFSIIMSPMPPLDGHYVVFGEVLTGFDVSRRAYLFVNTHVMHQYALLKNYLILLRLDFYLCLGKTGSVTIWGMGSA